MNAAKPIHGAPVPLWQQRGLQPVPPVECGLKVGDVVTFTNDAGLKFPGKRVVGFGATVDHLHNPPGMLGHFVYIDSSSWWFPHRVDELTLTHSAQ
jgi:hypothetical protein